jgi:hypothetical protein
MIDIGHVHIAEPFSEIFPVDNKTLRAIQENIAQHGFDEAEPLIVWKRNGKLVCVDGHTRYMAAQALGLPQVPVIEKSFNNDDEAVEYAIHRQRDRRNLSDAELWKCMQWMDKRKTAGRPSKLAQDCANFKSAEQTAQTLGISARKVEQVRTVMDHGDEETIQAIEQGEMSINKAYEETRKKRKGTLESKEQDKFWKSITSKIVKLDQYIIDKGLFPIEPKPEIKAALMDALSDLNYRITGVIP